MTSSSLDKRRRTYVRLVGKIQNALNQALAEENQKRQLTRTGMAAILNTDKSFVTRKMNGTSNMTLETLADLAFALDRVVNIELLSRTSAVGANIGNRGASTGASAGVAFLPNWNIAAATTATAAETAVKQAAQPRALATVSDPVGSMVIG